jgi:hypothetical protein
LFKLRLRVNFKTRIGARKPVAPIEQCQRSDQ